MLLKGAGEVRAAPRPEQAAEMVLVRLAYAAELPSPAEAVEKLKRSDPAAAGATPEASPAPVAAKEDAVADHQDEPAVPDPPRAAQGGAEPALEVVPEPTVQPESATGPPQADPQAFDEVVILAHARDAHILRANLVNHVHLVRFEPGNIEFRPTDKAPPDLANDLSRFLNDNTARRWVVTVSREPGEPTIRQQQDAAEVAVRTEAAKNPLVQAVMKSFPGAKITDVRAVAAPPAEEDEAPE